MDLSDVRLARAIQDLIDRRVTFALRNELPRSQYGVVEGGPDTSKRTVAVRLYGLPQPSPGFVYSGIAPRDGDHVRVFVHPRGDRYVDAILGRDAVSDIIDASPGVPDEPIDRAFHALARVPVAFDVGSLEVVQALHSAVNTTTHIADFSAGTTPVEGNVLAVAWELGGPSTTTTLDMPGWEQIPGTPSMVGVGGAGGRLFAFWKVAGPAESLVMSQDGNLGAGRKDNAYLLELAGVTQLTTTESGTSEAHTHDPGVLVAPPAGLPAIVATFMEWNTSLNSRIGTPKAGVTEWFEEGYIAGGDNPIRWVGTEIVASAAGSYDVNPVVNGPGDGAAWASISAAFTATGAGSLRAAPEIVDGDDPTYHASALAEAVEIDLGIARRIVRMRLLIACSSAGAKSYELRASNVGDFATEVTLATLAFTAAGAFATNDVSAVWNTATSYRYFRLVGPAEVRRIHSLELYEATPGSTIVTDPTTGDFAEIDAALAALQAELDGHEAAGDPHPGYTTAAELAAYAQPLDAELTAIAALVSAADKLPYFTGSGAASLTTLSAFIRTLLDDANAAAALATLGAAADPTTTRGDIIVRGVAALGRLALGAAGKVKMSDGTDLVNADVRASVPFVFGDGSTVIAAGAEASIAVPRGTKWELEYATSDGGPSGSITWDVQVANAAQPGSGQSIINTGSGGAKPGLSSATYAENDINHWTTTIDASAAHRIIRVVAEATPALVKAATLTLHLRRTA